MNVIGVDSSSLGRAATNVALPELDPGQSSPLMKLVDAVSNLSNDKMLLIDPAEDNLKSPKPCTDLENVSERLELSSRAKDDDELNEEDERVIVGTKDDLVRRTTKKTSFAEFLMNVINDEANSDFIRWMPDGKSFTIVNHKKFTMDRMPKIFKIRNMSSFVRKLTRWGFHRVLQKETGNCDIFRHEHFVRGKPELVKNVRCLGRVAEIGANAAGNNTTDSREDGQSISNIHHSESGSFEFNQFVLPAQTHKFGTPMTSRNMILTNDLIERIGAQNSEVMLKNLQMPQMHGVSERRHLLARQEEMRRAILARQEAELERHELLRQKQLMNGLSNSSVNRSYHSKLPFEGSRSASSLLPGIAQQEIIRQEHQLQQQERNLLQQQRALELAWKRHEQEVLLMQQQVTSSPLNRNIDMNLEADLMNASTRSIDFLGSSCRSMDLGISGRALDFLGISNRSATGDGPVAVHLDGHTYTSHVRQHQRRRLYEQQTGRSFATMADRGIDFIQSPDDGALLGNSDKLNCVSISERDIISGQSRNTMMQPAQRDGSLQLSNQFPQPLSTAERDEMLRYLRSNSNRNQALNQLDAQSAFNGFSSSNDLIRNYLTRTAIEQEKLHQLQDGHRVLPGSTSGMGLGLYPL